MLDMYRCLDVASVTRITRKARQEQKDELFDDREKGWGDMRTWDSK